jgi:hypothetical protein
MKVIVQGEHIPTTTRMKNSAISFWHGSTRCLEQRRNTPYNYNMALIPGVVCMAFSIELGFKALLSEAEKDVPQIHDLDKLFSKLEPREQKRIIELCGVEVQDFYPAIEAIAKVFIQWRYIYEPDNAQLDVGFLQSLSDATYTVVTKLEVKPGAVPTGGLGHP